MVAGLIAHGARSPPANSASRRASVAGVGASPRTGSSAGSAFIAGIRATHTPRCSPRQTRVQALRQLPAPPSCQPSAMAAVTSSAPLVSVRTASTRRVASVGSWLTSMPSFARTSAVTQTWPGSARRSVTWVPSSSTSTSPAMCPTWCNGSGRSCRVPSGIQTPSVCRTAAGAANRVTVVAADRRRGCGGATGGAAAGAGGAACPSSPAAAAAGDEARPAARAPAAAARVPAVLCHQHGMCSGIPRKSTLQLTSHSRQGCAVVVISARALVPSASAWMATARSSGSGPVRPCADSGTDTGGAASPVGGPNRPPPSGGAPPSPPPAPGPSTGSSPRSSPSSSANRSAVIRCRRPSSQCSVRCTV